MVVVFTQMARSDDEDHFRGAYVETKDTHAGAEWDDEFAQCRALTALAVAAGSLDR